MRPISTRAHGVLDFATSGLLMVLPRVMGWSPQVTRLLTACGATSLVYSFFTKYELGAVKFIPMKTHLTLDAMSGGMLLAAGAFMEDEDEETRATLGALGAYEVLTALTTQTKPPCPLGHYAGAANARHLPIVAANPEPASAKQMAGQDI